MNLYEALVAIVSQPLVRVVFGLLIANFVSGTLVALKEGTWRMGAIMDWMAPTVYFLLGGALVSFLVWSVPPEYVQLGDGFEKLMWLGICAALVGKVLDNLKKLGLPVPSVLTDRPVSASRP